MNAPLPITKSSFLLGRQCSKRFWLHSQGVAEPKPNLVEDELKETEVKKLEDLAEQLFPGCHRVSAGLGERAARTQAAMALGTVAQAEFAVGDLLAVVDILERVDGGWFLWEVKASTADPLKPKVKPIFEWDLAFQWHVLRAAGFEPMGAGLVMVKKGSVRGESQFAAADILVKIDRSKEVKALLPEVERKVESLRRIVSGGQPRELIGTRCSENRDAKSGDRPSDCGHLDITGKCGSELPDAWVGNLPGLKGDLAERLFEIPNRDLRDLPIDGGDWSWSEIQRRVILAAHTGKEFVDPIALRDELKAVEWPVTYVDFEFDQMAAVPRYPGWAPYEAIPFQWALCVQERPGDALSPVEGFLHEGIGDPRTAFAESLLKVLPATGSLVAHHASAEKAVLESVAKALGGVVADRLAEVVGRLRDSERIAKAGYYHPKQKGSWSIKKLAPCLTGRGYEDLEIQQGMIAVLRWRQLLEAAPGSAERDILRRQLRDYCSRDVVLMHEMLQMLRSLAGVFCESSAS